MPSLRQIRYFLTIAGAGGFTQAAAELFIAQPALSRQIAQMERELGFSLFVREARGVHLTSAGQLFFDRVQGLEAALGSAADDARSVDRGQSGVLRLLHSSSVPVAGPLLAALQAFSMEAPAARVDLDRLSSEAQIAEIAAGRADLGLVRLPVLHRHPALQILPLAEERLSVALPRAHSLASRSQLTLAELAGEAFVSAVHRERGGLARRITDLCLARGFVPLPAAVISRKTSMLALVGAGFGIAIIPDSMRYLAQGSTCIVPLCDADATAVTARLLPSAPSPLAIRFAELCRVSWGAF